MGRRRPSRSQLILSLILALFSIVGFSAAAAAAASGDDYTNLVFKGCADQNFHDFDGMYKQTLKTLLDDLTSKSSAAKFYKTTSGDGAAINGLFQCRGDLSNDDCYRCMKRAPEMASKLCGKALAARVQLTGCYLRYEISGFRQVTGTELLYKVCGSTRASGDGFEDKLDTALAEIAKGVAASGNGNGSGFYAGEFQSVYVMGQCEGDLGGGGGGDCVNCVKRAADTAKSECSGAVSAQMYFQRCYISYTYYSGGVPSNDQKSLSSSSGTGKNSTEKTVAIAMGGLMSVGLVMACLLFTKSAFKKRTPYKYGG